jgi:glycosyltransferase involved in cell wall biosynthesis
MQTSSSWTTNSRAGALRSTASLLPNISGTTHCHPRPAAQQVAYGHDALSRQGSIESGHPTLGSTITAIILTRNEEAAIAECIRAAKRVTSDIAVIDSNSTDATASIAQREGARVVSYSWNGRYPKKKEWALRNAGATTEWVLLLDADERVSHQLAVELRAIAASDTGHSAYDIPLRYYWRGRPLKHGQTVVKRSMLKVGASAFPEVPDLDAPGITEVEGHYQPSVAGSVGVTRGLLLHDDPDPVSDWYSRHNKYSDWEAYLRTHPPAREAVRNYRSIQGRAFDRLPCKPVLIFAYNYIAKSGWRDGLVGLEFAVSLAFYQFQIGVKVREFRDRPTSAARDD